MCDLLPRSIKRVTLNSSPSISPNYMYVYYIIYVHAFAHTYYYTCIIICVQHVELCVSKVEISVQDVVSQEVEFLGMVRVGGGVALLAQPMPDK